MPQTVATMTIFANVTVCNGPITAGTALLTAAFFSTCVNTTYNASTVVGLAVCTYSSAAPSMVYPGTGNITTLTCNQSITMSNYSTTPALINVTYAISASSV